jgi:hypothetical protein
MAISDARTPVDERALMNPLTEAAFHVGTLFPVDLWQPGEAVEVRCLDASMTPSRAGPRRFFTNHAQLLQFAMSVCHQWDVFFGVGWRRCPVTGDMTTCTCPTKGGNAHVSRLTATYVDLDVGKAGASAGEIFEKVMASRLEPAVVVASGRGVHAYWTLDEPTSDAALVRRVNQGLRDRFNGDNAIDPARVLRLAGTLHRKQQPAIPVRLLRAVGEAIVA